MIPFRSTWTISTKRIKQALSSSLAGFVLRATPTQTKASSAKLTVACFCQTLGRRKQFDDDVRYLRRCCPTQSAPACASRSQVLRRGCHVSRGPSRNRCQVSRGPSLNRCQVSRSSCRNRCQVSRGPSRNRCRQSASWPRRPTVKDTAAQFSRWPLSHATVYF
jgi:hypothetical protein